MGDFRDLEVWKTAHKLTLKIYELTKLLPKEETYGLVSQIRRAAVSVESNIAEGEGRYTRADKINFFVDARSSSNEIQTQLLVIGDVYEKLQNETEDLFTRYNILTKRLNSLITFRRNNGK